MAVRRDTLTIAGEQQDDSNETAERSQQQTRDAGNAAWVAVFLTWRSVVDRLASLRPDGAWPTPAQLRADSGVGQALAATAAVLTSWAAGTTRQVQAASEAALLAVLTGRPALVASQLPRTARGDAVFNAVNQLRVDALTAAAQARAAATVALLPQTGVEGVYRRLRDRTGLSRDPAVAATTVLDRVRAGFDTAVLAGQVIARTETLDAARTAGAAWDAANGQTVGGWQWISQLSLRTCPSCWSMHGTIHPLTQPGPLDHQQGRCYRLPIVLPWARLGYGRSEPPSLVTSGQARFESLSDADQLRIMGPGRLAALKSGEAAWSDLSQLRVTPGWRDSYAPRPVSDLRSNRLSATA